jgi:signal transduction histidine kinase
VETLAAARGQGESIAEVAHDARNMVAALGLYCDLLEEPGVLATPYAHYGNELRLVAAASRRLVEKLVALDARALAQTSIPSGSSYDVASLVTNESQTGHEQTARTGIARGAERNPNPHRRWDLLPPVPIANLAAELLASRNLLAAMAGPQVGLTMEAVGGARSVRLTGDDLTRVLVNLVKNAAEAMPRGGRIHLGLSERAANAGTAACLVLTIEDNGPGIPETLREQIFTSGYTTSENVEAKKGGWPLNHRGLGLAITRSIVEAAGGRISAGNSERGGARFAIELPVRQQSQ